MSTGSAAATQPSGMYRGLSAGVWQGVMGSGQHIRYSTVVLVLVVICILVCGTVIGLQLLLWRRFAPPDLSPLQQAQERTERTVREEIARNRQEVGAAAGMARQELAHTLKDLGDSLHKQLAALANTSDERLAAMRETIEKRLGAIQEDNGKKLEEMRQTVDEKLQGTLEKRLGESFRQVSERLEAVHKGLGEMRVLATGVGDLKKVLSNVKTRAGWSEVQLGAMLEEVLNPDQFARNVSTKGEGERVEFAVKLPGGGGDVNEPVWLPIDAKFPVEDHQRLVEAQDKGDAPAVEVLAQKLEDRVRACASDIAEKYLNPPKTTDFGILFLPTESLFAETVRRTGLCEAIQRDYRVMIAGPTTLWCLLNSLQVGFRTLAIQKRSSEVWSLLAAVKTEWSKYGETLAQVKKKLDQASDTIDVAAKRTRAIGRKLKDVQELPSVDGTTPPA